jgi:predicted enzyme related to lactoylglutathione lyase
MANPVVHFEIIGKNTTKLQAYYDLLFGWHASTDSPVAPEISDAGQYEFIDKITTGDGTGIPGGIGGGEHFAPHSIFYVGVPDVEAALKKAEELGGTRLLGPVVKPGGGLVVGHFTDPEGNMIGVAGPQ